MVADNGKGHGLTDEPDHFFDFRPGSTVIFQNGIGFHVDDDVDFLGQMVIGNDLVKQHQVEVIHITGAQLQGRLCIADHAVSVIAYQTAGKGREAFDTGSLVLGHQAAQDFIGLIGGDGFSRTAIGIFCGYHMILAHNVHNRIITQERIPAPTLAALHAFQKKIAVGYLGDFTQQRNRCGNIRINFAAQWNHGILFRIRLNFRSRWS